MKVNPIILFKFTIQSYRLDQYDQETLKYKKYKVYKIKIKNKKFSQEKILYQ